MIAGDEIDDTDFRELHAHGIRPLAVPQQTREKIEAVQQRLRTDIAYFADFYFDQDLSPKQIELAKSCLTRDHTVGIFSRQSGKTTIITILIAFVLLYGEKIFINCYLPTDRQAKRIMFLRVCQLFRSQPLLLRRVSFMAKAGILEMHNGNIFEASTAAADSNVRGGSPTHILIDECQDITNEMYEADIKGSGAAMKNLTATIRRRILKLPPHEQEEALRAAATLTVIWEIGTAKGRGHFHDITLPGSGAYIVRQTWQECWFIDRKFVERERRRMLPRYFKSEFECEFDIAEGYAFERDLVALASEGNIEREFEREEGVEYFCGIDLGRKIDHTVLVIMKAIGPLRQMVFLKQWKLDLRWTEIVDEIYEVLDYWRPEKTMMDMTGPTGRVYDYYFSDADDIEGMQINQKLKAEMFRHTQILFQNELIEIFDDERMLREFWICPEDRSNNNIPKFPKPGDGEKDDQVNAVVLSNYAALDFYGYEDAGDYEGSYTAEVSTQRGFGPQMPHAGGNLTPHPMAGRPVARGLSPTSMGGGRDDDPVVVNSPTSMWESDTGWKKMGGQWYREI